MRSLIVTIEDVQYRFIPSKCLIYPVVSTDVIVDRWVKECFNMTPGMGCVLRDEYFQSYIAWGGNLSRIDLTRALLRLGYDAKCRARLDGKFHLGWSGVTLKKGK